MNAQRITINRNYSAIQACDSAPILTSVSLILIACVTFSIAHTERISENLLSVSNSVQSAFKATNTQEFDAWERFEQEVKSVLPFPRVQVTRRDQAILQVDIPISLIFRKNEEYVTSSAAAALSDFTQLLTKGGYCVSIDSLEIIETPSTELLVRQTSRAASIFRVFVDAGLSPALIRSEGRLMASGGSKSPQVSLKIRRVL